MNRYWQQWVAGLCLAGAMVSAGLAQETALPAAQSTARPRSAALNRGGGFGFAALLERTVGLSAEQSDAVRGLLAEQRRQTQALREQTDSKIRALLNPDQQKKFDNFLAEQKTRARSRYARAS